MYIENNAYAGWTPLRNLLRKLDLIDTLGVIRAYSTFRTLRTQNPFPTGMEVPRIVYSNEYLILPWDLEILAREALIVCDSQPSTKYTAREWNTFADLINKLHDLNNYISENTVDAENILQEVTVRTAHQQFRYQTEYPSIAGLLRYALIFEHIMIDPIVQSKTGLSSRQLFTIGTSFWSKYTSQYLGINYPLDTLEIPGITQADCDAFVQLYSLPMTEMRQRLAARKLDDTFNYQFHALQSHPLIFTELRGKPAYICPLPTLFFWRITSGLFYDLVKNRGFDQAFGASFQDYVGDMLKKTFQGSSTTIYPEEPDRRPKRTDWIIDQPASFMLVECKTKRMTLGARTTIQDDEELREQLEVMSEAVVQSYQAHEAYKHEKYHPQQYPYNPNKQPFSLCCDPGKLALNGPSA